MRRTLAPAAIAGLGLSCISTVGAAQEYCISCTEPQALYRCVISDPNPNEGQPMQMLCITTLAKRGGHATCSVRAGTVFDCDAPIARVSAAAPNAPAAPEKPRADLPPPRTPKKEPDPQAQPDTVEQLAKQIAKSSTDQAKKAGQTVSDSMRKAWTCFTSFFSSC